LAWRNRPPELSEPSTRNDTYAWLRTDLELLYRGLPERFRPKVGSLLEALDGLFTADWPMVMTNGDLVENNMHFDPNTGRLEEVIDWNDAVVAPFGTSVIGIECLLGWYARNRRLWVDNAAELREGFWAELARAVGPGFDRGRISTAAQIGLFRTYGLIMGEEGKVAVQEGSLSLRYLEDLCLADYLADRFGRPVWRTCGIGWWTGSVVFGGLAVQFGGPFWYLADRRTVAVADQV
jgi:hypothetical protein